VRTGEILRLTFAVLNYNKLKGSKKRLSQRRQARQESQIPELKTLRALHLFAQTALFISSSLQNTRPNK
jgi:hypothetical protein